MAVRPDCRHYSSRSTRGGATGAGGAPGADVVQRCRLGVSEVTPFACPEACPFFEHRSISEAGWQRFGDGGAPGPGSDRPGGDPPR